MHLGSASTSQRRQQQDEQRRAQRRRGVGRRRSSAAAAVSSAELDVVMRRAAQATAAEAREERLRIRNVRKEEEEAADAALAEVVKAVGELVEGAGVETCHDGDNECPICFLNFNRINEEGGVEAGSVPQELHDAPGGPHIICLSCAKRLISESTGPAVNCPLCRDPLDKDVINQIARQGRRDAPVTERSLNHLMDSIVAKLNIAKNQTLSELNRSSQYVDDGFTDYVFAQVAITRNIIEQIRDLGDQAADADIFMSQTNQALKDNLYSQLFIVEEYLKRLNQLTPAQLANNELVQSICEDIKMIVDNFISARSWRFYFFKRKCQFRRILGMMGEGGEGIKRRKTKKKSNRRKKNKRRRKSKRRR